MSEKTINARVIVTYGRSFIALRIAQSLGQRGADIIGCDDVGMTVLAFSKFVSRNLIYTSPQKDPEKFISDLARIIRENKPEDHRPYILMPSFYEARLIAENRDRLGEDIIITVPSFEAIDAVDPKDHLAKTLAESDIESPEVWFPKDDTDIQDVAQKASYPVFIKPPDEVGGRGIQKVGSAEALKEAFQKLRKNYPEKQLLVQEMAKGRDYCFCGLFDHGRLVSSMVYHNTQKFPRETGAGSVRETVDAEKFNPIAAQLMERVKWNGVCEIDFMWDGNPRTTPMMIEVNPRFWSGLDHSVKSNIDFPYQLYQLFVDGQVTDKNEPKIGHKTQLPGMSTLGAIEAFMGSAVNFDKLEKEWPHIKDNLKDGSWAKAFTRFKDSLEEGLSFDEAYENFKSMHDEIKNAQAISAPEDDPFVGLGVLFVLGSLLRYGQLPPEVQR